MVRLIVGAIAALAILVVAIIATPVLKPLSDSLFSTNATIGWPVQHLMIARGMVYIIVIIILGAALYTFGRAFTSAGGFNV